MQIGEGKKTSKTLENQNRHFLSLKMFTYIHFGYCDAFRVLKEKKELQEQGGRTILWGRVSAQQ